MKKDKKEQKVNKVVYGLIIDKSSSMMEIQREILQSLNDRIKAIKKLDKNSKTETLVELVMFNHRVKRLHTLTPAKEMKPLNREDYFVNGTTALYDALGSTLERFNLLLSNEIAKGTCKVVILVYTDGYENASRSYSQQDIKEMLRVANNTPGVEITMVGCDEETLTMAREMNFNMDNVVRTSKENLSESMQCFDDYMVSFDSNKMSNFKESYKNYDLDKE